ncbi:MAG: class I mannose-6-phosphate isomerase [Bacteroidales bacterium]|nr:class I mannose-6-phosphate isomerase [Candidatus Cacconaster caballi]
MKKLYPLKFKPVFKERIWGGNSFGDRIGEAWLVADMEDTSSVVSDGFLAENDLSDILETYMGDLVGDRVFDFFNLQFPVLIKTMDIADRLSVQVHPDDEVACERFYSYGKNEFWYITAAAPGSAVYMGFKRDTTAEEFYNACREGRVQDLMNVYHPAVGDCFFVEAGIVHSAAGGIRTLEIQQPSDITFRLYDWGRENDPLTRREMHLEEALDCISYKKYDEKRYFFRSSAGEVNFTDRNHFVINGFNLLEPSRISIERYGSFAVYICTGGGAAVRYVSDEGPQVCPLAEGQAVLVPSSLDEVVLVPERKDTHLLEVRMPRMEENEYDFYEEKDGRDQN